MSDQTLALCGSMAAFALCGALVLVSHHYCRTAIAYYAEARALMKTSYMNVIYGVDTGGGQIMGGFPTVAAAEDFMVDQEIAGPVYVRHSNVTSWAEVLA